MKRNYSLYVLTMLIALCAFSCSSKEKCVYYSEYGAVGDGVADDLEAIVKAHDAANEAGLPVRADAGATYYIGGGSKTAGIKTDTDWGDAKFIIDDRDVERRNSNIFSVTSRIYAEPAPITTVKTLKKYQTKIDLSLPYSAFVVATDTTTKRFIREGLNQNNGSSQTDGFVIDNNGNVDMKAPIIWDFDNISSIVAYPIDSETLTVRGDVSPPLQIRPNRSIHTIIAAYRYGVQTW